MSPFRSPKSPSTPAAVHRIESKAKIAKFNTSLSAATASRVFHDAQADHHLALKISLSADKASRVIHDAQADYHLAQAQASADEEAALDTEIAQETSLQGICKDYSAHIYKEEDQRKKDDEQRKKVDEQRKKMAEICKKEVERRKKVDEQLKKDEQVKKASVTLKEPLIKKSGAVLGADMTALEEEANRNILGLNISSNGEKKKKPWYRFGF